MGGVTLAPMRATGRGSLVATPETVPFVHCRKGAAPADESPDCSMAMLPLLNLCPAVMTPW